MKFSSIELTVGDLRASRILSSELIEVAHRSLLLDVRELCEPTRDDLLSGVIRIDFELLAVDSDFNFIELVSMPIRLVERLSFLKSLLEPIRGWPRLVALDLPGRRSRKRFVRDTRSCSKPPVTS